MYSKFVKELKRICSEKNYSLKSIGKIEKLPIYRIDINPKAKNSICFSAGIHGDEISGPFGVLEFLKNNSIKNVHIIIFPVLNPSGFDKGTYETPRGVNLNRIFTKKPLSAYAKLILKSIHKDEISMFVSIHEDDEMKGLYLYNYSKDNKLFSGLINFMSKKMPICKSKNIYGKTANKGIINNPKSDGSLEERMFLDGLPLSSCIEIPDFIPLKKRNVLVKDVVNYLCKNI